MNVLQCAGIVLTSAFIYGGCGPSSEELAQRASRQAAEERAEAERAAEQREAMRAQSLANLDAAMAAFGSCTPGASSAEDLESKWVAVRRALEAATSTGANVPAGARAATTEAEASSARLGVVRAKIQEGEAIVPPLLPDPVYAEPVYEGAWYISGTYRGNYTGSSGAHEGVVITKGGKYYVVLNADPADSYVDYLEGYVESTGMQVTLNVGRDGRVADVLRLADRETYNDDQAAYREAVAEAKQTYRNEREAHRQATLDQQKAVKVLAMSLKALREEEARLVAKRRDVLGAAAQAVHAPVSGEVCK